MRLWVRLRGEAEIATGGRYAVQRAGPDICTDVAFAAPTAVRHHDDISDGLCVAVVHVDLHLLSNAQLNYLNQLVHVAEHHLRCAEQVVLGGDKSCLLGWRLREDIQDSEALVAGALKAVVSHHGAQKSFTSPLPWCYQDISRSVGANAIHHELRPRVLGSLDELEELVLVRVHAGASDLHDEVEEDL
eukprot:CAMPEP_0180800370 /NCGR_PEP_ID=MMETSP1038_2-20121128/59060_1 /TAXON_ID=632150 /ORGANISM="Azadinium spinosum, Strain 3D9" /LENGTH=187 /DNA_ID=CAMNT_0022840079 /DNA_START=231 /DNA_END=794 /DNA_ORIENTATION=+